MPVKDISVKDLVLAELRHDLHSTPWWTLAGLRRRRKLRKQIKESR